VLLCFCLATAAIILLLLCWACLAVCFVTGTVRPWSHHSIVCGCILQGHVLQEALARGTVSRQQLILVGTVVLAEEVGTGAPASAATGTPLSQLPKLVADAQFWMGLEGGFDVLMVQLPPAMHSDALPSLVRTMEAAVDAGLARSYGVAAPRFTALSSGGDATPSLRRLFSAAELYNPKHRLSCVSYK
jgi:hypothetical protein